MQREYVRKTARASWSEANLLLASQGAKSGKPYRTLKRRIDTDNFVK
jgi:hypothetical protein